MKFIFLTVAGSRPSWIQAFEAEMLEKKLGPLIQSSCVAVKTQKVARADQNRKRILDSEALIKAIDSSDFVVLSDERGEAFHSLGFAKSLEGIMARGKKRILFITGGPYGVSEELVRRADLVLQLSRFTLNHYLAQMVLMEQVYRALSIQRNLPYHNE